MPPSPALTPWSEPDVPEWWQLDFVEKDSPIRIAVEELKRYFSDWSTTTRDTFWHRKSGKSVLSVVICQKPDGSGFVSHRGMNTEVSLPAGSLCAERAAMGRAASDFHSASSIVAIATMDPDNSLNPLWPCEVCQSWLAKLRQQSPEISVIAVADLQCEMFLLRVNGELRPPPPRLQQGLLSTVTSSDHWLDLVVLAEGTSEFPWEAKELIYVDGAWTFLHAAQQNILKEARLRGSHLLVGIHSDDVLRMELEAPVIEDFETRLGRILQNRFVDSVLKDAPWCVTQDLIDSFGIRRVITGSVSKVQDGGGKTIINDPYSIPKERKILEIVPSIDTKTERSIHQDLKLTSRVEDSARC